MKLWRWFVLALLGACAIAACGEPDDAPDGGSAGTAAQSGSSSGTLPAGGAGNDASAGETARGGGGDPVVGGAPSHGGEPSAAGAPGSAGADCSFPQAPPVSGSACPVGCEGRLVAYEDCDGAGSTQAACASDWFLIEQSCGDHLCQDPAFAGQSCGASTVCAVLQGGAQIPECLSHACGTGPITCDCLSEVCPGCVQTGVLDFTCNTCPSGTCP